MRGKRASGLAAVSLTGGRYPRSEPGGLGEAKISASHSPLPEPCTDKWGTNPYVDIDNKFDYNWRPIYNSLYCLPTGKTVKVRLSKRLANDMLSYGDENKPLANRILKAIESGTKQIDAPILGGFHTRLIRKKTTDGGVELFEVMEDEDALAADLRAINNGRKYSIQLGPRDCGLEKIPDEELKDCEEHRLSAQYITSPMAPDEDLLAIPGPDVRLKVTQELIDDIRKAGDAENIELADLLEAKKGKQVKVTSAYAEGAREVVLTNGETAVAIEPNGSVEIDHPFFGSFFVSASNLVLKPANWVQETGNPGPEY